jgi:hypothetical protein
VKSLITRDHGTLPISAVLRKAANLLTTHGHCKGVLKKLSGEMCVMGAVNEVVSGDGNRQDSLNDYTTLCAYIVRVLGLGLPRQPHSTLREQVVAWNNNPDTSKAEVVEGLRRTANALDSGEI